MIPIRFV